MTAAEFKAACQILWGKPGIDWAARSAADYLGVNERNVYHWGAGQKDIPPGVANEILVEMQRRLLDPADNTPALVVIRAAQCIEAGTRAA